MYNRFSILSTDSAKINFFHCAIFLPIPTRQDKLAYCAVANETKKSPDLRQKLLIQSCSCLFKVYSRAASMSKLRTLGFFIVLFPYQPVLPLFLEHE